MNMAIALNHARQRNCSHGPCHLARNGANMVLAATFICNAFSEIIFLRSQKRLTLRICTLAHTVKRNVQCGFIYLRTQYKELQSLLNLQHKFSRERSSLHGVALITPIRTSLPGQKTI